MAAETSRRGVRSIGLVVRPQAVSAKSYVDSVVGFINEVVPQARQGEKEAVVWVRFEYCDLNDYSLLGDEGEHNGNNPPLLLILGYTNGVQIWSIPANGEAQEALSWRQGPVRHLRVLPTPVSASSVKDKFPNSRPLIALCDSTSAGEQFCSISFISLKTGDRVDGLKFSNPVVDIKCNKKVIAVTFLEKINVYHACNFKELLTVSSCYPSVGSISNPIALGSRWLAFADKKLITLHQTSGGMAGDAIHSYASSFFKAAQAISQGLTVVGSAVTKSLTGHKPASVQSNLKHSDQFQPGIVTIVDFLTVSGELNLDDDSIGEGIVAHFPAHANEPVAALSFDPSGMLLFTSSTLGQDFNIFRIFPHPACSSLGAVHHLYTLHRGDTSATVLDVAFSLDSRWVAVSTLRGTTHIFPITPYGGPITVRTHTSPRVVNRLSRFHRSAGLEDIQHPSSTGRNSPVLSGSPGSSGSSSGRVYDSHPSVPYHSTNISRMGNARLPPYPHPTTVTPAAQLKQSLAFPLTTSGKPKSPSVKDKTCRRTSSGSENVCLATAFAPARAWLVGSPSLTRDKREKPPVDSLYIMDWRGNLTEYLLEPKSASGAQKTDDAPIELDVTAHAQWNLLRSSSSTEIQPPLPVANPLMLTVDMMSSYSVGRDRTISDYGHSLPGDSDAKTEDIDEIWLSQVEIITHAGPHRRLWMGPQFSFQTFQQSSNTTVLSSTSSALLSQSPDEKSCIADIYTEELDVQNLSLRPARSNPMAMPGSYQATSGSPGSLLLIEASSGSFEQLPVGVCGSWPEGCSGMNHCRDDSEEQLKESIADAMIEYPFSSSPTSTSHSGARDFQGSYEELSSSSSHSGSVSHSFDTRSSPAHCMEHVLVFPTSGGSPDSP